MPKPARIWLIRAVLVVAGLGALAAAGGVVAPRQPVQEVTLVARGMAFTLEGSETENPDIRIKAGQKVRIRFRNEDPGVDHALNLPELHLSSAVVKPGHEARLDLVARMPGKTEYECTLHSKMMRGTLLILP